VQLLETGVENVVDRQSRQAEVQYVAALEFFEKPDRASTP
jgi:hypothetical protein